jgi:hypothetical protein
MNQATAIVASAPAMRESSRYLVNQCFEFFAPLLHELDRRSDRHLVQTVLNLVFVIVIHRHRNQGLAMSEPGDICAG